VNGGRGIADVSGDVPVFTRIEDVVQDAVAARVHCGRTDGETAAASLGRKSLRNPLPDLNRLNVRRGALGQGFESPCRSFT
jgi:hypothetical protein